MLHYDAILFDVDGTLIDSAPGILHTLEEVFQKMGVDVTGVSKGKGFQGSIKRHGFSRGPMQHGSKYHRRNGSLGAKGPARVFLGRKGPGRMGGDVITIQGLQIVKVDAEKDLILIRGAVPGPKKSIITIRNTVKA